MKLSNIETLFCQVRIAHPLQPRVQVPDAVGGNRFGGLSIKHLGVLSLGVCV